MYFYNVEIYQHGVFTQIITTYAKSINSARLKALRMFREDNNNPKGITAISKLRA